MKKLKVRQTLISESGKTVMYIVRVHRDKTITIAFKRIDQQYVDTCDIVRVSSDELSKCIHDYGYFYLGIPKYIPTND